MDLPQKQDFIENLIDAVRRNIVERAHKMPEDWDGEELRRYIADRFEAETNLLARGRVRQNGCTKRLAAYHAALILREL